MQPQKTSINAAQVIAWGSILLGFGVTQGVIYLKSYWDRFGLDPFQFNNASDLAIVGLTGIGVTVVFMMSAALFGGYISHKMEPYVAAHRWALLAASVGFIAGLVALAFFVDFGIYLLIGMLLTWGMIWLVHRSPDLPESITKLRAVPYIALAVAYVPMASHYYGQRKADYIIGVALNAHRQMHSQISWAFARAGMNAHGCLNNLKIRIGALSVLALARSHSYADADAGGREGNSNTRRSHTCQPSLVPLTEAIVHD